MITFEDACVDSPAGVALLAALAVRERSGVWHSEPPVDSTPTAVDAAVRAVASMTFGQVCSVAVDAAEDLVGPWVADAAENAAAAYRCAEARRPIAAMIGQRFDRELHAPMDTGRQQWWTSADFAATHMNGPPYFEDYGSVYGNGEFTWAGLWTVTEPSGEVHDELVSMSPGPISRWHLPVGDAARVFEIHRPQDWLALVAAHPVEANSFHGGWELPGPDQSVEESGLLDHPQQHAAVGELSAQLLPNWASVAEAFDAVHLSWAGFITSEGYVTAVGDGAFTMLRYWGSERTHWLHDCFSEPEPVDAPSLSGRVNGDLGVSCLTDRKRRDSDFKLLSHLLGR